ncbi:MAG: hypothetical protein HC797_10010 [Anaerolineales bacterium]|nr:hypothetical protein [Anaerolineales bacterium]
MQITLAGDEVEVGVTGTPVGSEADCVTASSVFALGTAGGADVSTSAGKNCQYHSDY